MTPWLLNDNASVEPRGVGTCKLFRCLEKVCRVLGVNVTLEVRRDKPSELIALRTMHAQ
jgi:hypothetical protein